MTDHPDDPDQGEIARRVLVADEIYSWLGRRRISAARAAVAVGVSPTYLYRRLNAETPFSTDDLFRLADLLGVPADVFLHVKRGGDAAAPVGRRLSPATAGLAADRRGRETTRSSFRSLGTVRVAA